MIQKFLETATTLALEAASAVMGLRKQPISRKRKEDFSLVTEADLRSDQILSDGLRANFPDHAVLSEESGLSGPAGSEWVWVIDPLDGTKAYARGMPGFSVMVGLLKEGRPHLGVVVDPMEGLVYQAMRGCGATLIAGGHSVPLHVSNRSNFREMPLALSTDFPQDLLQRMIAALHAPILEPINSVGIKIGLVVRQKADIYFSHHAVHDWDSCAPQIILEEAGGVLAQVGGESLVYHFSGNHSQDQPILASNGTRHAELAKIISLLL